MSTRGALATGRYTEETVRMARANNEFVIGFIAQRRMEGIGLTSGDAGADDDFLVLAPGVGFGAKGDMMGQQYRTPDEVVRQSGCDIIIVGRGIYGTDLKNVEAIRARAERYREEGWNAYLRRVES
jgi:orotidine-5'-phosphate decarboxylase